MPAGRNQARPARLDVSIAGLQVERREALRRARKPILRRAGAGAQEKPFLCCLATLRCCHVARFSRMTISVARNAFWNAGAALLLACCSRQPCRRGSRVLQQFNEARKLPSKTEITPAANGGLGFHSAGTLRPTESGERPNAVDLEGAKGGVCACGRRYEDNLCRLCCAEGTHTRRGGDDAGANDGKQRGAERARVARLGSTRLGLTDTGGVGLATQPEHNMR